jgi:hypothetical protein
MTALAGPTGAAAPKPVHRVECACSWVGYRRHPHSRPCPKCQAPAGTLRPVWLAGCAPRRGRCAYLAHISPQYKHAQLVTLLTRPTRGSPRSVVEDAGGGQARPASDHRSWRLD